MTTHSSILAWKTPGREKPCGLNSWGCKESDRLSDWAWTHSQTHTHPTHLRTNRPHGEKAHCSLHDSDILGAYFSQIKSILQSEFPTHTDCPRSLVCSPCKETAHGHRILICPMAYTSSFHVDNWPSFNNTERRPASTVASDDAGAAELHEGAVEGSQRSGRGWKPHGNGWAVLLLNDGEFQGRGNSNKQNNVTGSGFNRGPASGASFLMPLKLCFFIS